MASVNKVILLGRLAADPETRDVKREQGGAIICTFTVATSRKWKSKTTGEQTNETEWNRIVMFDRIAQVAKEYLKKGSMVYIEGRLKTRKYEDKTGVERYTTEIIGDLLQIISDGAAYKDAQPIHASTGKENISPPCVEDDDIPF